MSKGQSTRPKQGRRSRGPAGEASYAFSEQRGLVAQICNLLYPPSAVALGLWLGLCQVVLRRTGRRFVIGRASESSKPLALADVPQNAILRYGAARRVRNQTDRDRSPVAAGTTADECSNVRAFPRFVRAATGHRSRSCESSRLATIPGDTDRLQICATSNTHQAFRLSQLLFLFAVLFIVGNCGPARAKEISPEFDLANKLYEEGKYSEAAAVYEKAVKAGQVSAALCFNLGNALFKAGQSGRALVWYRRAEALAPRDPDIQANLQFVRKNVTSGVSSRNWRARLQKLSLNEWTLLTVAVFWIWFVLLTLREGNPKLRPALRGYTSTAGIAVALLGTCLALAWYDYTHATPAVVIVAEAVVRRGPLDESQSFYTLRDGSEITVLDQKNDWLQVIDQSKRIGWLRRDQVMLVRPSFDQRTTA